MGFTDFVSRNKETIAVLGGLAVLVWWVKGQHEHPAQVRKWIPTFPGIPKPPPSGWDFAAFSRIHFR